MCHNVRGMHLCEAVNSNKKEIKLHHLLSLQSHLKDGLDKFKRIYFNM